MKWSVWIWLWMWVTASPALVWSQSATDFDGDTITDVSDICPFAADPNQLDSGGIWSELADGIGDGCQCGDLNYDGIIDLLDPLLLWRYLNGRPPGCHSQIKWPDPPTLRSV